jgi:hypothetical protein
MKKNYFLAALLTCISFAIYAQQPNIPKKFPTAFGSFTFPLGSKILLELRPLDSIKFEYRVLSIEHIEDIYSFKKNEDLFSTIKQENTIELYFMPAYYNEGQEDKDYKTLLMLRNNLDMRVNYKADIKYYYADKFENTSIVGASPGSKTQEIWPRKIDLITLYNFEKSK